MKHLTHIRSLKGTGSLETCFVQQVTQLSSHLSFVERLDKASTAYGMEISAEKTKLMTSNTSGISRKIKINGQKLETVTSIRYLGSVITDENSKLEILSRIAQTTAALTRLKPV